MIRKNSNYQPILNTEGNHYFEYTILDEIEKLLKSEVDIDKTSNTFIIPKTLGKEKDYKIIELHKIAENLDISIFNGSSKKKKLKKLLYNEIKYKMNQI